MAGNVDPRLYVMKSVKNVANGALCGEDNLMIGDMMAIDNAIAMLKSKGLVLKIVEELQDYLSCKIKI